MKYELWANKDKTSLIFLVVEGLGYEQNLQPLKTKEEEAGEEIRLIWTTEADTYNQAMQKYYDFMGWGKYKPIDE